MSALASAMSSVKPLPNLDWRCALFLDLDGTLSHLAPTPDAATIEDIALSDVAQLQSALKGAVAIISGRPIAQIDHMCYPWHFTAAGQHGLEIRHNDIVKTYADETDALQQLKSDLADFHVLHSELLLEHKGLSVAIHYRQAPELADAVLDYAAAMASRYPGFHFQHGKMVCEIRLKGADKGTAIQNLMQQNPFAAKIPVFIGDDTTDEDGFRAVNAMQGISIKVGDGDTIAQHRIASVTELHAWLSVNAKKLTKKSYGLS